MKIVYALSVGVLVAAALGSAGVASADPLTGSYTATVTGTIGDYLGAPVITWVFTPCGPDCVVVDAQNARLHPTPGGGWAGTYNVHAVDNGEVVVCSRAIPAGLATASDICPQPLGMIVNYQLTKNG